MIAVPAADVSRETSFVQLDVNLIDVADNVRIDPGELEDLAASIRQMGVLEPVKAIGPHADGRYRLVYGQRRLLASRKAGQATIPAIVETTSDVDEPGSRRSIEQLVENLQRQDLNPIEEAHALRTVLEADPKLTQVTLAKQLGRHPSWVSNSLRLLETAPEIIDQVREGKLTSSHARALVGLAPKTQREYAARVVEDAWTTKTLERQIAYERENAERIKAADQEKVVARTAAGQKAIQALEKRKATWTDRVVVHSYYGQSDVDAVAAALKKAGYADVVTSRDKAAARSEALDCDCHAWLVTLEYGTPRVAPACVVPAHVTAKRTADDAKRSVEYALHDEGKTQLAKYLEGELIGLSTERPMLARVLLWRVLSWGLTDWAKTRTGEKRPDPWAVICGLDDTAMRTELAQRVTIDDSNGVKVPWAVLIAQMNGEDPLPADEVSDALEAVAAEREGAPAEEAPAEEAPAAAVEPKAKGRRKAAK